MGGVADSAVSMAQGLFSEAAAFTRAQPIYDPSDGRELKGLRLRQIQASLNQERNAERGLTDAGLERELRDVRQRIVSINMRAKLRGEREYQGSTLHFISLGYQDIADSLAKERRENQQFYHVDPDFQNSFTGKIIGAAGQMVPQSLASALPGVGLVALQSQAFQLSLDDALETAERTGQPYDSEKAYAYAFSNAFMQALLEKAGMDAVLGKWIKEGGEATLRATINKLIGGGLAEGGTETVQGALQDYLATTAGIEARNTLDLAKRSEEFAIGGILGTGLSSFKTVSDALAARANSNRVPAPPERSNTNFEPDMVGVPRLGGPSSIKSDSSPRVAAVRVSFNERRGSKDERPDRPYSQAEQAKADEAVRLELEDFKAILKRLGVDYEARDRNETGITDEDEIVVYYSAGRLSKREKEAARRGEKLGTSSRFSLREEVIHAAYLVSLRREWEKSKFNGTFFDYVHAENTKLFDNIRETIEAAKGKQRKLLTQALLDSFNLYNEELHESLPKMSVEQFFSNMDTKDMKMEYVAEFLRQTAQLKRQGRINEEIAALVAKKLMPWVMKTIARLRSVLPGAYDGHFGPEMKRRLDILEKELDSVWPSS